MALFDRFRRAGSRCAPNPSRNRARCSVELLESRLAPSGSSGPPPDVNAEAPQVPVPGYINDAACGLEQISPGNWAAGTDAGGDYALTWASDPRDGTGWNVYAVPGYAAGAPPGEAFAVDTSTTGDQGHAAVPTDPSGSFALTWTSDTHDGMGWHVYRPPFGR